MGTLSADRSFGVNTQRTKRKKRNRFAEGGERGGEERRDERRPERTSRSRLRAARMTRTDSHPLSLSLSFSLSLSPFSRRTRLKALVISPFFRFVLYPAAEPLKYPSSSRERGERGVHYRKRSAKAASIGIRFLFRSLALCRRHRLGSSLLCLDIPCKNGTRFAPGRPLWTSSAAEAPPGGELVDGRGRQRERSEEEERGGGNEKNKHRCAQQNDVVDLLPLSPRPLHFNQTLQPPQLALLAGASYGGVKLRVSVRAAQREQSALCAEADSERGVGPGNNATNAKGSALQRARRRAAPRVAVDAVFARRLLKIMKL